MSDLNIEIEAVDHVELYVANKTEAVRWYKWVFGLDEGVTPDTHIDNGQPALIPVGDMTLALYQGDTTPNEKPCSGIHRLAFRTTGDDFIAMLDHLDKLKILMTDDDGNPIKPKRAVDHGDSYSVYFSDFDHNYFEIITYEYDYVKERIPIMVL